MRQASKRIPESAEKTVRDIRRATRRHHSAEEKIRIVLEGLRGEDSIAELCRKEGDLALAARHDGLEHVVPAVSAVHVAGTQSTAFEVAKLVEHEQCVIAGALVMTVPDAQLLLAVGRAHA